MSATFVVCALFIGSTVSDSSYGAFSRSWTTFLAPHELPWNLAQFHDPDDWGFQQQLEENYGEVVKFMDFSGLAQLELNLAPHRIGVIGRTGIGYSFDRMLPREEPTDPYAESLRSLFTSLGLISPGRRNGIPTPPTENHRQAACGRQIQWQLERLTQDEEETYYLNESTFRYCGGVSGAGVMNPKPAPSSVRWYLISSGSTVILWTDEGATNLDCGG
ncbi:hypothetical protein B0H13DRAFT_1883198 [Mycena leptocephala]|nr:hypothetical protein B0H13DRAFT_1883198 [Mycena leptocephala]